MHMFSEHVHHCTMSSLNTRIRIHMHSERVKLLIFLPSCHSIFFNRFIINTISKGLHTSICTIYIASNVKQSDQIYYMFVSRLIDGFYNIFSAKLKKGNPLVSGYRVKAEVAAVIYKQVILTSKQWHDDSCQDLGCIAL